MSESESYFTAEKRPEGQYRDPYIETQEAIYEHMGKDPQRAFPIQELATIALKFGEIDPLDLTLSAAIDLQRMGLIHIDKTDRYSPTCTIRDEEVKL